MFNFLSEINKLIAICASLQSTHTTRRVGAMVAYSLPRNFYTTTMDWYDDIVNKCKNAIKNINKMELPKETKDKMLKECEDFIKLTKDDKNYRTKKKNLHLTLHRETNFEDNGLYRNLVNTLFNDMTPLTLTIQNGRWFNLKSGDRFYILEFDDTTLSNIQKQLSIYSENYKRAQQNFSNSKIQAKEIKDIDFAHITISKHNSTVQKTFPNMFKYVLDPLNNNDTIFKNKSFVCNEIYLYFLNKTIVYDLTTKKFKVEQGI